MKTDDAHFVDSLKRITERVEKYDERILTVLKYHLVAEQTLNDLLAASGLGKSRKFAGKIDVAKGLSLPELSEELWAVLTAGNKLRNAVAHGEEDSAVEAKMTDLRTAFLASVSPEQRKGVKEMTDKQLVTCAFSHCAGYLVVAAQNKKAAGAKK